MDTMLKRLLSLAVALVMVIGLMPWNAASVYATGEEVILPGMGMCDVLGHSWVDATYDAPKTCSVCGTTEGEALTAVAAIGSAKYSTLAEAVEKAEADAVVTLLEDAEGTGIVIDKNITIDLNNNNYVIVGEKANGLVGSTGTETLGIQILAGNDVTIKDGYITANTDACKMLVQNYANLTLTNVQLDGTNSANMQYVLSNNSGNVLLEGETSIYCNEGTVAFDVCKYASYEIPTVTVNTTGSINGPVEVTGGNLELEAAEHIDGLVYTSGSVEKAETVTLEAPEGYEWKAGVLTTECKHEYFYACDQRCMNCGELTNLDAAHDIKYVAESCYNIEHWYCEDCGSAWTDEALTRVISLKSVNKAVATHDLEHTAENCYTNEFWYCSACDIFWADEALTQITNRKSQMKAVATHDLEHTAENCYTNEFWYCSACDTFWADEALTQITTGKSQMKAVATHDLEHTAENCYTNEFWYCSACDIFWADEALTQITNRKSQMKAVATHDLEHTAENCYTNEFWYCSACDIFWADEALTQITNRKSQMKAVATHDLEHTAENCYTNEFWYCSACDTFWADEALTQITTGKSQMKAVATHDLKYFEPNAPTYEATGNNEYWYCSACDTFWADKALTQITNSKNVIIPMLEGAADVDGVNYENLDEALAAWTEGTTLTLRADAEIANTITITESKTLKGNGKTLTYTGSGRAIDITNAAGDAVVVIENLDVVCGASYCERGINYNATGSLTLDGVSVEGATYAVNIPGKANGAEITITDSELSGCIALNVWGTDCIINVTDSVLNAVDNSSAEGYAVVKLNNDGITSAEGTKITVTGGSINVTGEYAEDTEAVTNGTSTGIIDTTNTTVNGETVETVAVIRYGNQSYSFQTLQDAVDFAKEGEVVVLTKDLALTESIKVTNTVTVDLNGNKLTGPDDGKANWYAFIVDGGNLTLKDSIGTGELWAKCYGVETKSGSFTLESGKITATNNKTYGSAVVNYGGTVIINGGELSGALASVSTGGHFAVAETVINGGTLNGAVSFSDYNAKGSTIKSASNDVPVVDGYKWIQDGELYVLAAVNMDLPDAQVDDLGAITVTGKHMVFDLLGNQSTKFTTVDAPFNLQIAKEFTALDTAEEAALSYYADYNTDFFIKISGIENGSFIGDGCYLAGQYSSFSDQWVVIPLDGFIVKNGVLYPMITAFAPFTYEQICESVKNFKCGIYITPEILAENENLEVTLELGLSETKEAALAGEYAMVKTYTHTAEELNVHFHTYDDNCDAECNGCGEFRGDAPHNLTICHEAVVPANCQETGHEEYWECADCGGYFKSNGMGGYYQINPEYLYYIGEHVRPEGAAGCAVVKCELCGEDTYGEEDCVRPEGVSVCVDSTCEKCGGVIYGDGHSYGYDEETWESLIPLCQPGICINCNEELEYIYEHNGSVSCIDSECEFGCGQVIPASSEHVMYDENWSLVAIDPCVGGTCENCNNEIPGNHNYVNGVCTACGEADPDFTGSIRLRSAALELLEKISIVYKASDDLIATDNANVAERGVLLYDSAEKAAAKDPAQAYETVILEWDASEQRYVGMSEGIDARDMGKSQFAVAYLKLTNGNYIFGTKEGAEHTVEYSPLIYCRSKQNDPKVGTLCRAIMHYGAAAQVVQYNQTTGLMNEGFAAVAYDATVLGESVFSANTDEINGMDLKSVTMDLQGALSYVVKYTANEDISGKTLYAEYSLLGKTDSVELVLNNEGRWEAIISGIPAKDMGATLKVKPYYLDENGAKVYGGELVYSGYEYTRRALENTGYTENVKDLAKALAMYIYYADQYGN